MSDFKEIPDPTPAPTILTAAHALAGPPIEPLTRLLTYLAPEWEAFVDEWVSYCLKKKYKKVLRFTGSGDRGIDIAGFADDKLLEGVWDNYQCKHYDHPLMPSDVWSEIGKVLWYSFQKHFAPPRAYYFVAPRGTGTTLTQYLANSTRLKSELLKVWDKSVCNGITDAQAVPLIGEFGKYFQSFNFGIFKPIAIRDVIEQHRSSPYFLGRFGGGLPARPKPSDPPEEIQAHESKYVSKLLEAYGDHESVEISECAALKNFAKLDQHFRRQREAFFHAESLRVFVRDKVEPGTFESLQDEIYHGVIDTHDADHADGFQRVVAVTGVAQNLPLSAHPLAPSTMTRDKHGICHQLANEDRLQWKK